MTTRYYIAEDELIRDRAAPDCVTQPPKAPTFEQGYAVEFGLVPYRADAGKVLMANVIVHPREVAEFLHAHAAATLPPGTRYELRQKQDGQKMGACWYRCTRPGESFDDMPDWGAKPNQFTTPAVKLVAA